MLFGLILLANCPVLNQIRPLSVRKLMSAGFDSLFAKQAFCWAIRIAWKAILEAKRAIWIEVAGNAG
jgi:hypothetical protein